LGAGGGGAAGFSGGLTAAGGGAAGFSAAAGGFASSSAMMRRIEARISSIEGSWTFAGCVISDSRSSTRSHHVVLHQARRGLPVLEVSGRRFHRAARLVPRSSVARHNSREPPPFVLRQRNTRTAGNRRRLHESLRPPNKGYVMALNDCKQSTGRLNGSSNASIYPQKMKAR
jgi:hypothetical protein